MDLVLTGNTGALKKTHRIHRVLRPGYTLCIGDTCHDGRPITESYRYQQALAMGIPMVQKKKVEEEFMVKKRKEPFLTKYRPVSLDQVIGHRDAIQQIVTWLEGFNGKPVKSSKVVRAKKVEKTEKVENNAGKRGVFITGPSGIGKTMTAQLIAIAHGYTLIEYYTGMTVNQSHLQKELLLIDSLESHSDGSAIADLIQYSTIPVICIANERVKTVMAVCLDIPFERPLKSAICTALLHVAKAEKIPMTRIELEARCEANGHDIRALLNGLEMGSFTQKDAVIDPFTSTKKLFAKKSIPWTDAEDLVYMDSQLICLLVQEAYPNATQESIDDLCSASEMLSYGDLVHQKIMEDQEWGLLPVSVSCTVAATRMVRGMVSYVGFPKRCRA